MQLSAVFGAGQRLQTLLTVDCPAPHCFQHNRAIITSIYDVIHLPVAHVCSQRGSTPCFRTGLNGTM
jgi:hypothetical protein